MWLWEKIEEALGTYQVSLTERIARIEEIINEETRMEAINHAFSAKTSMDRFSYGVILAFLGAVIAGLASTLVTLFFQKADVFSIFADGILLSFFSIMLLLMYLHTLGSYKSTSDYYTIILNDLILRRQGVP